MHIILYIIIIIHGLIHILGFLKAFKIIEIKEITLNISKPVGLVWLLCTMLFITYSVLDFFGNKFSWLPGLVAVILSQLIIVFFWRDAKFGTIPNIIITVLISFGAYKFNEMIEDETAQILYSIAPKKSRIIMDKDFRDLPPIVQKWLRTTGIIGKPEIKFVWIKQKAQIKMKPEQKDWYIAEAEQYSTTENPAFIWTVTMQMMDFIKINGRDKFFGGKGEMLINLFSIINIVNEKGEKLNEGTIQRYLGELVWIPSLALSPYIRWDAIDEYSAKATINYKGTTGYGTFYFNEKGDFIKFIAIRYMGNEPNAKRYPWILTVDDYSEFDGIRVPVKMEATWKLDDRNWTWLKLDVVNAQYTYY